MTEPATPSTPTHRSTPLATATTAQLVAGGRAAVGHPEPPRTAEAALRSSQLVSMVLIIGVLIGGGGLGFLGLKRAGAPVVQPTGNTGMSGANGDAYTVVVLIAAALALAVAYWGPGLVMRGSQRRFESRADDEAAMARVFQGFMTASVLRGAALELPGVLGAFATMLTGNWLMLLATVGSVVALAVTFPRSASIERWIDEVTGGAAENDDDSPENA